MALTWPGPRQISAWTSPGYRNLSEVDKCTLCLVMCPPCIHWPVDKRGTVKLLLNDSSQPVEEANIWEIMVSPHIFDLELLALFAEASHE